jgi:hypothetical protein
MDKLAEGTRMSYKSRWHQWCLWRRIQEKAFYLKGETKQERQKDEDDLLRFVVCQSAVMSRQEGTVKQKLFAVRHARLVAGHDDPTLRRSRLWIAVIRLCLRQSSQSSELCRSPTFARIVSLQAEAAQVAVQLLQQALGAVVVAMGGPGRALPVLGYLIPGAALPAVLFVLKLKVVSGLRPMRLMPMLAPALWLLKLKVVSGLRPMRLMPM